MEEKELKNEATSVKEETSLKENENKFLRIKDDWSLFKGCIFKF